MQFEEYIIVSIEEHVPGVFRLRLAPKSGAPLFTYIPGQFCQLKDPTAERPEFPHSFSVASTPTNTEYLEFCFRVYGPWTQGVSKKHAGDTLLLAGPVGRFIFEEGITHGVFLAGGVGFVPMYAMMKGLVETGRQATITMLYGNRSEADIAYRSEIDTLIPQLPNSKVVHILSDLKPDDPWAGYRGFITREILEKEVDLATNPTFFLCGPPIFVKLMNDLLKDLQVDPNRVKQELYSSPPPPKPTISV